MFILILKSAYHHVGSNSTSLFCSLPFYIWVGYRSVHFTRLYTFWSDYCSLGLKIIMYLDGGAGADEGESPAHRQSKQARKVEKEAGNRPGAW